MRKILLVHGPNLNLLGARATEHYGEKSLSEIETMVAEHAKKEGFEIAAFQSNHEGALIDFLQKEGQSAVGIVINPGALTHGSFALHDALIDTKLPCVEVHLSDIGAREAWRRVSVTAPACIAQISGKKEHGYRDALAHLVSKLKADS